MPPGRIWTPDPVEHDHPLNQGVLSWWLGLEELSCGNTFYDILVKNPGTLTNGPTWGSDPNGFGAVEFDGSDDYVNCGSSGLAPTRITVSCLLRTTAVGTVVPLNKYQNSGAFPGYSFRVSGVLGMWVGGSAWTSGATAVNGGGWRHCVGTYDGSTCRVYVDGELDGSQSQSGNLSASESLWLGGVSGGAGLWFPGSIADMRVYDCVLSADEISGLYDQGLRGHPDTLRRVSGSWFLMGDAGGGFSDATGSSSLTFGSSAAGSASSDAAGSSSVAFGASAAGSALADATGSSSVTFAASAVADSSDATGSAGLTFAASAAGSALSAATGSSSLAFGASAAGSALADAAGSSSLAFGVSGDGASLTDGSAVSSVAFAASAVGSSLASAAGSSSLTFGASASSDDGLSSPGGTFHRPLWSWPRVYERPRPRTWRRVWSRALPTLPRVWRWRVPTNTLDPVELTKTVSDDRDYGFDFSKAPEMASGTGLTISSGAVSGGSGLTFGSVSVLAAAFDDIPSGKGVSCRISGGEDDTTYDFAVIATLSNGRKLTIPARLAVTADHE